MRLPQLVCLTVGSTLAAGCKAPPDAPDQLESLAAFLFAHAGDEDPAALEAGVGNVDQWLERNIDEAREGYTIDTLSGDAITGVGVDPVHA